MCVAAVAWAAHRDWLLVAVGNRDEYHARPAAPLARWDDAGGVLAGRDLKSGGTWLGVGETGRFALVTNRRGFGAPQPDKASRGALVTDLLTASGTYGDPATARLQDFNPFNLLLASANSAHLLTNRPASLRAGLTHGIYGLSNGALDEPWPKTLQLKAALSDWLVADSGDATGLFTALRSDELIASGMIPTVSSDIGDEAPHTPIFIRNAVYGTRCSSIVTVDRFGQGMFLERRFDAAGLETGTTQLAFSWPV